MTLSTILKLSVVAILGCALCWWLCWWLAGSVLWANVGALFILVVHAPVLALELVLARWQNGRDPVPKATLAETCHAWWAETLCAVVVFGWRQAFRSARHADHLPADAMGRRAVLLVHGFMCNRGLWNPWWPRLQARHVPTLALTLQPVFTSIDDYAQQIDAAVRRLTALTGMPPVVVAHSMGGLAVRAWLRQSGDHGRVHRVVTIGTPHRGTWLARFGFGSNAGQMRFGSAWFKPLSSAEGRELRAKFTCYYSHCDNVVFPSSSATLPDADNRHLRGRAHIDLLDHPAILAEVLRLSRE